MIAIKDHKVLRSLLGSAWHNKMIALALWCSARFSQFVITDAYREGDPGVHGTTPCRGMDMRSTVFEDPQKIADDINSHWVYDPNRPGKRCAVYHDTGLGPHIHLQVHNATVYHENGNIKVEEV